MKYPFLLLVILILSSCSSTSPEASRSIAQDEDNLLRLLMADLAPVTRVITHDTYVYHWTSSYKAKLDERNEPRTKKGVERGFEVAKEFQDSSTPEYGLVGGGLYMARDPIMSSSYGDTLISVTLPAGTRILDIRYIKNVNKGYAFKQGNRLFFSSETVKGLNRRGCGIEGEAVMNTIFKRPKCVKIFKAAFTKMKIVGNIHLWWGNSDALCNGEATAFALWDKDLFVTKNVRTYTADSSQAIQQIKKKDPEAAEEIAYIYGLAHFSGGVGVHEGSPDDILNRWDKSAILKAYPDLLDKDKVTDWQTKHTYNCKGTYPEDLVGVVQDLRATPLGEPTPPAPPVPMQITSATYGGNLEVDVKDNALKKIGKLCDGKSTCNYSNFPLEKSKKNKTGDLIVEWSCADAPANVFRKFSNSPIEELQEISCPADQKPITKEVSRVLIKKASYGGNDVTKAVQDWCGLKFQCDYKVSHKFVPAPIEGSDKSFSVDWICTDDPGTVKNQLVPDPALNKLFTLQCSGPN